mgnify:CR=1 FL=1
MLHLPRAHRRRRRSVPATSAQNELDTLNRIHAPEGTRLACQLRPQGNVSVIPLLAATPSPCASPRMRAVEREIAVMLVGFRWTATPHGLLPQDLLYLLNRYSEIVGDTVRKEGGSQSSSWEMA